MPALQAEELFACLARHDVRYVLIGGMAAVLHGANRPKDRRMLPVLYQLLEEIQRRGGRS